MRVHCVRSQYSQKYMEMVSGLSDVFPWERNKWTDYYPTNIRNQVYNTENVK